jgi:hypothetical protein
MQIKEVIESVLKVSSLILVFEWFRNCDKKVLPHFEGEKRRKSPILQENIALYASRV